MVCCFAASHTRVLKFFLPLGLPLRLPEVPLGNWVCFGGLPRPIFGSSPVIAFTFGSGSTAVASLIFGSTSVVFFFLVLVIVFPVYWSSFSLSKCRAPTEARPL